MTNNVENFDQLVKRIKALVTEKGKPLLAVLNAEEHRVSKACMRVLEENLATLTFIGNSKQIEQNALIDGRKVNKAAIIDVKGLKRALEICTELLDKNTADAILIGNFEKTMESIDPAGDTSGLFIKNDFKSHVAVFEHAKYPKLLIMSDAFINVYPDIKDKMNIIQNSIRLARLLGIEEPKVALLAAVEIVYPGMTVTKEAALISSMVNNGQIPGCIADGPLSFDIATVPEVARQKGAVSKVAGRSDILIVPNIETGHGIYKAMSTFAKAKTGGLVTGGKVPIAVSSLCDSTDNIYFSFLLGVLAALS